MELNKYEKAEVLRLELQHLTEEAQSVEQSLNEIFFEKSRLAYLQSISSFFNDKIPVVDLSQETLLTDRLTAIKGAIELIGSHDPSVVARAEDTGDANESKPTLEPTIGADKPATARRASFDDFETFRQQRKS